MRRRALELDFAHRETIKGIKADTTFSDSFKQQRITQEQGKYAAALAALQSEAESTLTLRAKKVQQRLAELAQAETEHKRKVLGDAVLVGIYKDRLSVLTPDKIVSFTGSAAGEWETMLLDELADLELSRRAQGAKEQEGEDVARALFTLRGKVAQAAPERDALELELHELRDVPALVQALDVPAERQHMAVTYGFRPENVVIPE